jgi:hypothetical protein
MSSEYSFEEEEKYTKDRIENSISLDGEMEFNDNQSQKSFQNDFDRPESQNDEYTLPPELKQSEQQNST